MNRLWNWLQRDDRSIQERYDIPWSTIDLARLTALDPYTNFSVQNEGEAVLTQLVGGDALMRMAVFEDDRRISSCKELHHNLPSPRQRMILAVFALTLPKSKTRDLISLNSRKQYRAYDQLIDEYIRVYGDYHLIDTGEAYWNTFKPDTDINLLFSPLSTADQDQEPLLRRRTGEHLDVNS